MMFDAPNSKVCNVAQYQRGLELSGRSDLCDKYKNVRFSNCKHLFQNDLIAHFGCVNAIEFSHEGKGKALLTSGGDDKRVLLWDLEKVLGNEAYKPSSMMGSHVSNIFCLAFNNENTKLLSSGNDEQILVHDVETRQFLNLYVRENSIYSLSAHPFDSNVFAIASEDGTVKITDMRENIRDGTICLSNFISAFHGVAFNPVDPTFVATAHSKVGAGLWDIRKPKQVLLHYGEPDYRESVMSIRFNKTGTNLFVLRRRKCPRLYNTHSTIPLVNFHGEEYLNSCTMKSGCFASENDQYVVSGSDNFKVYIWKIPLDPEYNTDVNQTHIILKGHRSIVNQVRYNPVTQTLVSSGVEKTVKIWSPFKYPGFSGEITAPSQASTRNLYTRTEYIDLVLRSAPTLEQDYENESTFEDPRMMAFFDSLLQHDRSEYASDSSSSSDDDAQPLRTSRSMIGLPVNRTVESESNTDSDEIDFVPSLFMHGVLQPEPVLNQQQIETQTRIASLRQNLRQIMRSPQIFEREASSSSPVTLTSYTPLNTSQTDIHPSRIETGATPEVATQSSPQKSKQNPSKRTLARTYSTSSESDEPHRATRRRNAARNRKRIKWKITKDNNSSDAQSTSNREIDESKANAYERSAEKLSRSVTLTDLRFAEKAERLANALNEYSKEESSSDSNSENDFNLTEKPS